MFYTGKGSDGKTEIMGSGKSGRISKTDLRIEALGDVDELNSLLGICKVKLKERKVSFAEHGSLEAAIHEIQEDLFTVLAELAGAERKIAPERVSRLKAIVSSVEKEISPVTSFVIPGDSEMSAYLDLARTVARRAERKIVAVEESGLSLISEETKAYINCLSDLLFALARLTDHKFGIKEEQPEELKDE